MEKDRHSRTDDCTVDECGHEGWPSPCDCGGHIHAKLVVFEICDKCEKRWLDESPFPNIWISPKEPG